MRPGRSRPGTEAPCKAHISTLEIAPPASGPADRSQVRRGFGRWTGSRLQTTKRNQHVSPSRALPAISSAPQPSLRSGSLSPNHSDDHGAPLDRRENVLPSGRRQDHRFHTTRRACVTLKYLPTEMRSARHRPAMPSVASIVLDGFSSLSSARARRARSPASRAGRDQIGQETSIRPSAPYAVPQLRNRISPRRRIAAPPNTGRPTAASRLAPCCVFVGSSDGLTARCAYRRSSARSQRKESVASARVQAENNASSMSVGSDQSRRFERYSEFWGGR
jgi:hypothetical protein